MENDQQRRKTANRKNTKADIMRARALRKDASSVEQRLWESLSVNGEAKGIKFRRQHPLHPYITDFACMAAKVVVEIDGLSHDGTEDYDRQRTKHLNGLGYEVLRFANDDVVQDVEAVVDTILQFAVSRMNDVERRSVCSQ